MKNMYSNLCVLNMCFDFLKLMKKIVHQWPAAELVKPKISVFLHVFFVENFHFLNKISVFHKKCGKTENEFSKLSVSTFSILGKTMDFDSPFSFFHFFLWKMEIIKKNTCKNTEISRVQQQATEQSVRLFRSSSNRSNLIFRPQDPLELEISKI